MAQHRMNKTTRRRFLQTAAAGIALPLAAPALLRGGARQDKVRLAAVGVGGKGWTDLTSAARFCEVVAICDVDTGANRRGGFGAAAERWPEARRYTDWRKLLDAEHKHLDAVTVSTPDHMHAPVTMTALQHGLATYTQKPLTRTVHEARALAGAAKRAGVSTQMGNQHHSGAAYRTLVEIIRSGAIGKVRRAHAWSNRPIWPQGIVRPAGADPVPDELNWDLWLGAAPERPFKKGAYHPFKWRGWYDFGAGALGDMGCHIIDPVVWSLGLTAPKSVSYHGPEPAAETFPKQEAIQYRFDGTKHTEGESLEMTWWDGGKLPPTEGSHFPSGEKLPSQGVMLIGGDGTLVCRHGGTPQLYPEQLAREAKLPQAERLDHYGVWIDGVRDGSQPNSNFAYAGPLTEIVLLGVIASRVGGGELQWDAAKLQFTNSDAANRYVKEDYRRGWEVPGLS